MFTNHTSMLKNFFKTTLRNLWKNKGYSFLNIFGLAIGITCAALIFLWVEDELAFDQFNVKKDRLFFIRENQKYDTYTATFGSTPGVLAPAMQAEIPGIANTCRMSEGGASTLISIGDKAIYSSGNFAEPSIFTMFSFPFVQGNAETAFRQRYSMVITEATAKKFFGEEKNVVGKSVRMDNKQDYVISGVIKDIPRNSTVGFEWVAPFEIWFDESPWAHSWGNNCLSTFVELKPGVTKASVDKILYNIVQKRDPESIVRPFLFSMNDWHLRNQFDNGKQTGGGQITYIRLFSIIAWIILLVACINFMNLATARSERRAREVGVRKVLGAVRNHLVIQFISEALFTALLAACAAIIMIALLLPAFNLLVDKNLVPGFNQPSHLVALFAITFISGLIAGSYPSFYLSSFNPVFVLKGIRLKAGSAEFIRKGLVVLQFTVSIVLFVSTIIIYQQVQHVKSRNLGLDKNNLLQTSVVGNISKNYSAIRQDLLNTGVVENVALTDHTTLNGGNNTGGLTWEGKATTAQVLVSTRYVTPEFMQTSGIKLLEGRDLVPGDSAFSKKINVVITSSFAKLMGAGSGVGKLIHYEGDTSGTTAQVVGVVNDYIYGDMYGKPDPVMFFCTAPGNTSAMYIRIKKQANIEKAMKDIESVMKKDNPSYPFDYQFVDDQFNRMFLSETLISKLSRVFASLAIIISCLGLFGLAAYTAERRTKEIGIRKVLGASVTGITALLSKDFLKLIGLSALIAFPVAWWAMHSWLNGYAYRVTISWWVFIMAGVSAIVIALVTISFQSVKAALMNPVKSLRSE